MEPKRFACAMSAKLNALFVTLIGVGGIYFGVLLTVMSLARGGKDDMASAMFPALMAIGALAFTIFWGIGDLIETFAVYLLYQDRIEKRSLFGVCSLRWQDVRDCSSADGPRPAITLTGESGRKMRIRFALLHDPARELVTAVNQHLAPLRERQAKDMGFEEFRFYPARGIGFLWLTIVSALVLVFVLPLFGVNTINIRESDKSSMALLVGAVGTANLVLGLMMVTKFYALRRGELSFGTIFGATRIALDRIAAVSTRQSSNGQFNITTVQDHDGGKIAFSSALPNHAALRAYLMELARPEAKERGAALDIVSKKKEAKQIVIGLSVISAILFGFIAWMLWDSVKIIREYRFMDAHGIAVTGRVTEKYTGSKNGRYLLYEFTTDGQEYHGKSPVPLAAYNSTESGATIPVLYMPGHPDVSRLTISKALYNAWFNVGLAVFMFILYTILLGSLLPHFKRKAQQKITG